MHCSYTKSCLENIYVAKNVENNQVAYGDYVWIFYIVGNVMVVKFVIMNHSMRLVMFDKFVPLKLLSLVKTHFSSIIMLKRFKLIKGGLQTMVISDKWKSYREDDVVKARHVKELELDDI